VLISGAGVAGPTAAYLAARGFGVTVVERMPRIDPRQPDSGLKTQPDHPERNKDIRNGTKKGNLSANGAGNLVSRRP